MLCNACAAGSQAAGSGGVYARCTCTLSGAATHPTSMLHPQLSSMRTVKLPVGLVGHLQVAAGPVRQAPYLEGHPAAWADGAGHKAAAVGCAAGRQVPVEEVHLGLAAAKALHLVVLHVVLDDSRVQHREVALRQGEEGGRWGGREQAAGSGGRRRAAAARGGGRWWRRRWVARRLLPAASADAPPSPGASATSAGGRGHRV